LDGFLWIFVIALLGARLLGHLDVDPPRAIRILGFILFAIGIVTLPAVFGKPEGEGHDGSGGHKWQVFGILMLFFASLAGIALLADWLNVNEFSLK